MRRVDEVKALPIFPHKLQLLPNKEVLTCGIVLTKEMVFLLSFDIVFQTIIFTYTSTMRI